MSVTNGASPRGIAVALTLFCGAVTLAQSPDAAQGKQGTQEKVAALKQSLAKNQAALKTYSWTETTEVSMKGEVKKVEQKECHYGPDGKVQKTAIPDSEPAQQASGGRRRGGPIKKAVVADKVEDLKEYLAKAAALVQEYVPPDGEKIQAANAAGNLSLQPSPSGPTLNIKDYLKPGDTLALGLDPTATKLRSFQVKSYLEDPKDDVVTLAVTFASLPDGTSYPQQTVLNAPAKEVQVKLTNSKYTKAGT